MTWEEIAVACEKADRASDQLNAEVTRTGFAPPDTYVKQSPWNGAWCIYETGRDGRERSFESKRVRPYTASVDACLELLRDVLRGWVFDLEQEEWGCRAYVNSAHKSHKAQGRTPALALLAAIARAKAAQGIEAAKPAEPEGVRPSGESPVTEGHAPSPPGPPHVR